MDNSNDGSSGAASAQAAMEIIQKSIDAMAQLTARNLDTMASSTQLANQRLQSAVHDVAAFAQASLARSAAAISAMSGVTSPVQLLQIQTEFARAQFDATRSELALFAAAAFAPTGATTASSAVAASAPTKSERAGK